MSLPRIKAESSAKGWVVKILHGTRTLWTRPAFNKREIVHVLNDAARQRRRIITGLMMRAMDKDKHRPKMEAR